MKPDGQAIQGVGDCDPGTTTTLGEKSMQEGPPSVAVHQLTRCPLKTGSDGTLNPGSTETAVPSRILHKVLLVIVGSRLF